MKRIAFFAPAVLIVLFLLAPVLQSSEKGQFNLATDEIFESGSAVQFRLSSKNIAELDFRAYKIDDPIAFFQTQEDVHRIKDPDPAVTGETVKERIAASQDDGVSWFRRMGRKMFSPETRKNLIEKFPWLRSEPETPKTAHVEHDPYAPLNEKNLVETWTETIDQDPDAPDYRWDYKSVELKVKNPGVYLIEGYSREHNLRAYTVAIVSDLAFFTKSTQAQALIWTVKRKTGEPVADAQVTVLESQEKQQEGRTDPKGLFSYPRPEVEENSYSQPVIMVQHDGHFAISDPYFYSSNWADNAVYVYTDRPIYRPGQTVYFKGILRNRGTDAYQVMASDSVTVEIRDSRSNVVDTFHLISNSMGTFNGEFTLDEEPPLGTYNLIVTLPDETYYYFHFKVDEYKKPEYEVIVKTEQQNYIQGDRIDATIEARYYFGEPVRNAEVEYYVFRSEFWIPWWYWYNDVYSWYFEDGMYGYDYYGREMVHSGTGQLTKDGTLRITYDTETGLDKDFRYIVQARVVDASRREITGSKQVIVSRGEFFIQTLTDKWVYEPGEDINLTFKTIDFSRNPVSAMLLGRIYPEKNNEGDQTESEQRFAVETSNGEGLHTVHLNTPGYYKIEVTGLDRHGNEVTNQRWIYVSDRYSSISWRNDGIQIVPDKNQYDVGDTAHVMVITPFESSHILATVEGRDIYHQQVASLDKNAYVLDIPITARMQPNSYIAVSMLFNNRDFSQTEPLIVPPVQQFITVNIEADKDVYRPGETATFTVTTTDHKNQPVSAELSVGIVDEAIYALEAESTEDIQKFFYGKRWNNVSTYSSLYFQFYGYANRVEKEQKEDTALGALKGEADFVEAKVRKDFRDTAYWGPTIMTSAGGKATVSFTMPDNLTTWRTTVRAVNNATQVGSATMKTITRKDLLVRLETPRFLTQDDEVSIATIVHNYLDTAKTCRVSFEADGATYAGRYEIPSQSEGVSEPTQISANEIELVIPPTGEAAIEWRLLADRIGTARLVGTALTDEESDAMELSIPVLPHGMEEQIAHSGEISADSDEADLSFTIPETAIDGSWELQVSLSPSLAASALSSMDYLIGYPYGCVEQTMSRFLPTIAVSNALEELNQPKPAWATEIPKMVQKGLDRLYQMQHDDGGWGWWENDDTNAFNTAYVMYGLHIARQTGFEVDDWRYENGVRCLERLIRDADTPSETHYGTYGLRTTRAYLTYVYSLVENEPGRVFEAYFNTANVQQAAFVESATETIERMDYVTALNAMTLHRLGIDSEAQRLLDELARGVDANAAMVSWGDDTGYSWYNNEIETTAMVLHAFLAIDADHPLVNKMVRFLLMKRQGDRWRSTRDTAFIIYAFTDYLKKSDELNPDYDLEVHLNDRQVKQARVTRQAITDMGDDLTLTDLGVGTHHLRIKKQGSGSLFYSYRLRYFNTGTTTEPSDNGFSITRSYYRLESRQRGDEIVYLKRPFTGNAAFGDKIYVKIEVTADSGQEYVIVEDPIPAGCEVVKDDQYYRIEDEKRTSKDDDWWGWFWWYADRDIRDEKVAFFVTSMSKGTSSFSYILRAEKPGEFRAMPTTAELMYFPEVNGHGVETVFNIYDVVK